MRRWKYGYSWVTLTLFVISLAGHWTSGWFAYKSESFEHGRAPSGSEYAVQACRDTLENWQSEFLQLLWQVAGLAWLLHVGSPQSKEGNDRLEAKVDFIMSSLGGGSEERARLDAKYPRA